MTPASESPGLVGSLRRLAEGVLASVEDRVTLFAVELEEEKHRLTRNIVWVGVAFFAAAMALIFLGLLAILAFAGTARLAACGAVAAFYAILFGLALAILRRERMRQPRPFAATLKELGRDRACFPPED